MIGKEEDVFMLKDIQISIPNFDFSKDFIKCMTFSEQSIIIVSKSNKIFRWNINIKGGSSDFVEYSISEDCTFLL